MSVCLLFMVFLLIYQQAYKAEFTICNKLQGKPMINICTKANSKLVKTIQMYTHPCKRKG